MITARILDLLDTKHLKMADLCRSIGVATSTMANWKTRETDPPAKMIVPICEFLNVSPEYLLTGNESVSSIYNDTDPHFTELKDLYYRLPDRQQGELIGYAKRMVEEIAAKTSIPEEEEAHDPPGGVAGN